MEVEQSTTAYIAPATQTAYVLCADCGVAIEPNTAGLCVNCLRNSIDITEEIPKQTTVQFCRNCSRYLAPPQSWILAELESQQLMDICLRRLKGLIKVHLTNAGFIWTEPHSKRLRIKLTIQKEVLANTILQQVFEVEFVVQHGQCPQCARLAAKNMWRALVQVRQKVDHKRTFLYLEQVILKHNADRDTVAIKEAKGGLDFFYATRQHAIKMVEFLGAITPVRSKASEQLISSDDKNGTANYKFTYSVELVPICKDDIVCLPLKLARAQANISQILVCTRVGTSMHLVDPLSLQSIDLQGPVYWRNPFPPLASVSNCIEFVVLDVEPTSHPPKTNGRFALADVEVSPVASSMDSDTIFQTRSHLGGVLKPGDTVMGYYLGATNVNNDDFEAMDQSRIPEVVLVRKTYPNRRKKNKTRNWKLRSIAKEADGGDHAGLGRDKAGEGGKKGRAPGAEAAKAEAEYEMFLRDLEEDKELRNTVQLFRSEPRSNGKPTTSGDARRKAREDAMETDNTDSIVEDVVDPGMESGTEAGDEEEDDFPKIQMDELMDEMEALRIREEALAAGRIGAAQEGEEE